MPEKERDREKERQRERERGSNGDKNISNANLIVTCELNWPSNFDSILLYIDSLA